MTDLPDPVVPATKRCGIFRRSAIRALPPMSLPKANFKAPELFAHSLELRISCSVTEASTLFGTSTPTTLLPGIGASILTLPASRFNCKFFSRAAIFFKTTPLGGVKAY